MDENCLPCVQHCVPLKYIQTMKSPQSSQRIDAPPVSFSDNRFPDLGNAGWCRYTKAQADTLHRHRHDRAWEITYTQKGSMFWDVEGTLFNVEPGQLFLTYPDELHGGENQVMHVCELYWFIFRLNPKLGSFSLSPQQTRRLISALEQTQTRTFTASSEICTIFDRIIDSIRQPDPFFDIQFNASAQQLICTLLAAPPANNRPCSLRIRKAIDRLRSAETSLTIKELARTAGLKPSYFREQFKKETGYSPAEYQTLIRIQKAKYLLLNRDTSVTDIAFELGFSSSQHLSAVFRKITGQTPREFRRQNKP